MIQAGLYKSKDSIMYKIINYSDGGLCNRVLPLASCYAYAKITGRDLAACWPLNNVCEASFEDLFENTLELVTLEDIYTIKNARVFTTQSDAEYIRKIRDSRLFQYCHIVGSINLDLAYEGDAILYANNLVASVEKEKAIEFLKELRPLKELQLAINFYNLDKSFVGVHARLTDYPIGYDSYEPQIDALVNAGNRKIFLCSDDPAFERKMLNKYPFIITRHKNTHHAFDGKKWNRSVDFVRDGVVDLYLLSKTTIKVYNPSSSFTRTAMLIGGQEI